MMKIMNTWQFFAFGSAFFAALTAIFGKMGVSGINSDLATLIRTVVIVFVTAFVVSLRSEWQRLDSISPKTILFLVLSAIATGLSWLCYYRALQMGPASRVAPVDKLSVVMVMLLAFIFLKETVGLKEVIGGCLITAGAIIIALA